MNELDIVDVSESENVIEKLSLKDFYNSKMNETHKKDNFMIGVCISLIVLIILTVIIYFFGYELFKPIIKV